MVMIKGHIAKYIDVDMKLLTGDLIKNNQLYPYIKDQEKDLMLFIEKQTRIHTYYKQEQIDFFKTAFSIDNNGNINSKIIEDVLYHFGIPYSSFQALTVNAKVDFILAIIDKIKQVVIETFG